MNCKPGDIAVLVKPILPENEGMLLEVIAASLPGIWEVRSLGAGFVRGTSPFNGHVRLVQPGEHCDCEDWRLRPLRDNNGEDEILCLVGRPQEVTA